MVKAPTVLLCVLGSAAAFQRSRASSLHMILRGAADDLEQQAVAAAEAWDETATAFLDEALAADVAGRLDARGDVGAVVAGAYDGARRARLVFTHPELADATDAGAYATLLRISADGLRDVALYNVFDDLGVALDRVGDVFLDVDACYAAVDPGALKTLERLLPKSLDGVVTIEALPPGTAPAGDLVPAELVRLDTREKGKRR